MFESEIAFSGLGIKYVGTGEEVYFANDKKYFDNCRAISPKIGVYYRINNTIILNLNSEYQRSFGRTNRMNFAGLLKDFTLKWNNKTHEAEDVSLTIDDIKITNNQINKLPYEFPGLLFELGTFINLNKE
jgi:hypothetical protein